MCGGGGGGGEGCVLTLLVIVRLSAQVQHMNEDIKYGQGSCVCTMYMMYSRLSLIWMGP